MGFLIPSKLGRRPPKNLQKKEIPIHVYLRHQIFSSSGNGGPYMALIEVGDLLKFFFKKSETLLKSPVKRRPLSKTFKGLF